MKRYSFEIHTALAVYVGAALLLLVPIAHSTETQTSGGAPLPTEAGDFSLRVEPGLAIPLTKPQSQLFNVGGGQSIKAMWALTRYLDLGPNVTFLALPTDDSTRGLGTAWTFGGGLRLKRPHDARRDGFHAISPWVDADALYIRTDELNRFGFDVGAGLSVPIGRMRTFWLGPFARYLQIGQAVREGYNNNDAKILLVGLSLEVGSGIKREPPPVVVYAPEIQTVEKEVFRCPDRDQDGIPDDVDHCPDVAGPMDNWGCPQYKKIAVKRDKIELKEKLYFAWNEAVLEDESFPVLDEVALALKDNKSFHVQVEGHASSEGTDDHNQTLSEERAKAVLNYLVDNGIKKERLTSKGFGSTVPAQTNTTLAGREANRRVEFVVEFTIVNEGSK